MIFVYKHFDEILPDNDKVFFSLLAGKIESIDDLATVQIIKGLESYSFRIAPSTSAYTQPLLQHLLDFHNSLHIKLDLSKSIRHNHIIAYNITL